MKWISTDDRLPELNKPVLFYHSVWKCPVSASLINPHGDGVVREKTLTTDWPLDAFTHWMPLPKPPKEIENDNGGM